MRATLLALALLAAVACQPSAPPPITVGVTHGQATADYPPGSTPASLAVLRSVPLQAQALMGWGTLNPNPSRGVYDWATLDARIAFITSTGAEPVLTLCCAPDWMKGGAPGSTDWSRLEVAPSPARVADFAALAAAAATRYPQVHRFLVWNELKGFYDPATNAWDMPRFVTLYNAVYRAVHTARPDALVGGPYVPVDVWSDASTMSNPSALSGPWGTVDQRALDAITYWLAHNAGAEFVAVDGSSSTRDAGPITTPAQAAGYFGAVTGWLRARTPLPIWWAEFYAVPAGLPLSEQPAAVQAGLDSAARAGASVVMLWEPQAQGATCTGCLWSDDGAVSPLGSAVAARPRVAPRP